MGVENNAYRIVLVGDYAVLRASRAVGQET